MLVVGSRLRGNETLNYKLKLPRPLYRIDADPAQPGPLLHRRPVRRGRCATALDALADRLAGPHQARSGLRRDLAATREAAEKLVRDGLGPYERLVDELQRAAGRDFVWVRDVTVSNSTWGNRSLRIVRPARRRARARRRHRPGCADGDRCSARRRRPQDALSCRRRRAAGEHSASSPRWCRRSRTSLVLLMNDRGYGVIRNIQDAKYGGRRYYVDLHTPDFERLAQSIALPFHRVRDLGAGGRHAARRARAAGPRRDRDRHDGDRARSHSSSRVRPCGKQGAEPW